MIRLSCTPYAKGIYYGNEQREICQTCLCRRPALAALAVVQTLTEYRDPADVRLASKPKEFTNQQRLAAICWRYCG